VSRRSTQRGNFGGGKKTERWDKEGKGGGGAQESNLELRSRDPSVTNAPKNIAKRLKQHHVFWFTILVTS
jgi:hypothetical protein